MVPCSSVVWILLSYFCSILVIDAFLRAPSQPHQERSLSLVLSKATNTRSGDERVFTASDTKATTGNPATVGQVEVGDDSSTNTNGATGAISPDEQQHKKQSLPGNENNDNIYSAFHLVAAEAARCLLASDRHKDAVGTAAGVVAAGATNWVDPTSATRLQVAVDQIELASANHGRHRKSKELSGLSSNDEIAAWNRWFKGIPAPLIVDLTVEFCLAVQESVETHEIMDDKNDILSRLGCRLILLPSGAALPCPLNEPPGSMVYGKLLYGGVTRYRLLPTGTKTIQQNTASRRRAAICTDTRPIATEHVPAWVQYGGPDRMFEAVDMGAAAIFEVVLLPHPHAFSTIADAGGITTIRHMTWKPVDMFDYCASTQNRTNCSDNRDSPGHVENGGVHECHTTLSLSGRDRNDAFRSSFRSSVGGLDAQIDAIVRRVLDGRVIQPAKGKLDQYDESDVNSRGLSVASLEAEQLALLGLTPVRGLLLYGPPGCGKTQLSREISRALRARTPKILAAPELLDRWVGGSEKLVRALFADAEAELAACRGDATKSALHVIVLDEIDAVFRKRTSAEESGEATRSSVVNQILAKLDGVNTIPNVLLIGMTNRRELLDEALLRPGRLEVQIEIPLPSIEGRREILDIHFGALRRKGRLSLPLCCALDGVPLCPEEEKEGVLLRTKRQAVARVFRKVVPSFGSSIFDLAADYATGGFSGADLAGLVRCAGSIALSRARKDGSGVDGILITLDDVKQALQELKQ